MTSKLLPWAACAILKSDAPSIAASQVHLGVKRESS